jgi:hypothetical protein
MLHVIEKNYNRNLSGVVLLKANALHNRIVTFLLSTNHYQRHKLLLDARTKSEL